MIDEELNARVHAFLDLADDAPGKEGPLAGVTVGVKANIAVRGLPWTAGLEQYRHRIADRDAPVVARLRAAGAIIVGTLNMEEGALGAATINPFFGTTRNPVDLTLTAGGSSGGSGAAVAAGLCDLALGTDTLGSVRIPAAYCGVFGFKPVNDPAALEGVEPVDDTLDCVGPLARDLDLLERVARLTGTFGEGGWGGTMVVPSEAADVECEPGVADAFARAAAAFPAATRFTLPASLSRLRYAGFLGAARGLAHLDRASLSPALAGLIDRGTARSPDKRQVDEALLADARTAIRAALAGGAAILLPTAPQAAFALTDDPPASQADFTGLANIAGIPALSIPFGTDARGRPVAVQVMIEPGREAGLFALARQLQERNR